MASFEIDDNLARIFSMAVLAGFAYGVYQIFANLL